MPQSAPHCCTRCRLLSHLLCDLCAVSCRFVPLTGAMLRRLWSAHAEAPSHMQGMSRKAQAATQRAGEHRPSPPARRKRVATDGISAHPLPPPRPSPQRPEPRHSIISSCSPPACFTLVHPRLQAQGAQQLRPTAAEVCGRGEASTILSGKSFPSLSAPAPLPAAAGMSPSGSTCAMRICMRHTSSRARVSVAQQTTRSS